MNLKTALSVGLLLFAFASCTKPEDQFIGKWQILTVVENNTPVSLKDNWMYLKPDGTFDSFDGDLGKHESGLWTYQSKSQTLLIDGNGEDGDSEWRISTKNDTLFFHATSGNLYLTAIKMSPLK